MENKLLYGKENKFYKKIAIMKIKKKFLLVFLGLGLSMGCFITYLALNTKLKITKGISQFRQSSLVELESATEMRYNFIRISVLFKEYVHEIIQKYPPSEIAITRAGMEKNIIDFEKALELRKKTAVTTLRLYRLTESSDNSDELNRISNLENRYKFYKKNVLEAIFAYEKNGELLKDLQNKNKWKEDGVLLEQIKLLRKNDNEALNAEIIGVLNATNKSTNYLLVFALLALFLAVTVAIFMLNSIVNPILKLNAAVQNDTLGNLDILKNSKGTDEIGELAVSLNKMDTDLKKSRKEMEEHNRTLEQKVIERTDELAKNNDQLQVLMQSSSSILFRVKTDADFTVLYTSENVKQILGYSVAEMFVKHFWASNLHPEDAPGTYEELAEVFESGFVSLQYRFKHKDGSWRWMQAEMKCLFDAEGKPTELIGNWWDITNQKEIQDTIKVSNDRFELASKATRDVIYDWDLVTNALWMSDETFKSFGHDPADAANMSLTWWEEKIHPDDHDRIFNGAMSVINNKGHNSSENYRFKKGDGTYADVFDRGHVLYSADGQPLRWIGSMGDISEQKKGEHELRVAKEKAEESGKAKSEFLANMSHEIRTPLNGILGMTELALDTDLTTEQQRYLETVKLSCDSLMSLINDILDFSKIDAGKMDITPVDFSLMDSMPAILQTLGLKASYKNLEFVFSSENDVPDLLTGDVHRLQQIITNLVGNAIKFTEKGEVLFHIELKSFHNDKVMLLFSVTDTGIGIPENKLNYVFEEFTQADGSTTRKYGGTGLGLAITKRLIELMGGTIWVESEENKGSTFYFTLVMKVQKQTEPRFVPLPVLENTPVLVVEGNHASQDCIVNILQNFRMKPLAVDNGEEAIKELKKAAGAGQPYPLVLLDISLAGKMDGFDVAENIKDDKELNKANIIVISMSRKASDRERFALLGIDQYFTKPYSQSDLLDSIQNTLSANKKNTVYKKQNISMPIPIIFNTDKYKVLLVEDNLVNQEVARSMLIKKGHTVVIANNGEEAVAIYKNESFDLVLMDVQMPVLNGYEATQQIRKIENSTAKHTPVIGLTANAMKGDREKCLEAGMDDYVSKPVRFADLLSALDRVQQKSNASRFGDLQLKTSLVNLNTLLENLDGDIELLENVLEKFEPIVLKHMESIEINATKGNTSEIALLAHAIKGQCMNVEMKNVIDLAGQIEVLARQNSLAELMPLVPTLKSALIEGLEALEVARMELPSEKVA